MGWMISLYNIFGEEVLANSIEGQHGELNVKDLPEGMYIISASSKNFFSEKFLKQ